MQPQNSLHKKKCGLFGESTKNVDSPSNMPPILRFVNHIRKMWTTKSTFFLKCGPQSPHLGTHKSQDLWTTSLYKQEQSTGLNSLKHNSTEEVNTTRNASRQTYRQHQ